MDILLGLSEFLVMEVSRTAHFAKRQQPGQVHVGSARAPLLLAGSGGSLHAAADENENWTGRGRAGIGS